MGGTTATGLTHCDLLNAGRCCGVSRGGLEYAELAVERRRSMELKDKEQLKTEILQTWLRSAWVYPVQGPDGDRTFLRLTPGGRLKMRRRIGELESALSVKGDDVARQDEAGTLPVERDQVERARVVRP